jgi:toxin ParE1/3/4
MYRAVNYWLNMKPLDIRWSTFATKQVDAIYDYFQEVGGKAVAIKVTKGIIESTDVLRTAPLLGQQEAILKEIGPEYRYLTHGNYKLIYKPDFVLGQIDILDVFDTRQNPVKLKRYK